MKRKYPYKEVLEKHGAKYQKKQLKSENVEYSRLGESSINGAAGFV